MIRFQSIDSPRLLNTFNNLPFQARKWSSSNGVGTSSGRTINDKFIREEPEEGNARTVRQRRVVTENEKVKEAAKTDSSASARFRGRSLNHQQQRLHRRLCASIPSLLEGTKVSYYTDHSCGSACSLMAVGCGGGGSGGFNNKGYMYPYRCDYAQHVVKFLNFINKFLIFSASKTTNILCKSESICLKIQVSKLLDEFLDLVAILCVNWKLRLAVEL